MNEGMICEVLIEDVFYEDRASGMKLMSTDQITVWADKKMKEIIKKVPGVTGVYAPLSDTQFQVFIDHRYSLDWVKKEIEAAVLCAE